MSITGPAVAAFANKDHLSFNPTKHDDTKQHKATQWHCKQNIQVHERPVPILTDEVNSLPQALSLLLASMHTNMGLCWAQNDVILKVTSTAICGSDLHIYLNQMPGEFILLVPLLGVCTEFACCMVHA